jgi:hypothetical protein
VLVNAVLSLLLRSYFRAGIGLRMARACEMISMGPNRVACTSLANDDSF